MRARKSEAPFTDRIAQVWGGLNEVVRTADEPDVALADFFQVTPAQLSAWRDAEGRHLCSATTSRGHGCRNHASTLIDYDPRVWVSRDPIFCPAHLPSREEPEPSGSHCPATVSRIDGYSVATEDDGYPSAR